MEIKPKFYRNRFYLWVTLSHAIPYLFWSFVKVSLSVPIIETFGNEDGRGWYLFLLVFGTIFGGPFYYPFEEQPTNPNT